MQRAVHGAAQPAATVSHVQPKRGGQGARLRGSDGPYIPYIVLKALKSQRQEVRKCFQASFPRFVAIREVCRHDRKSLDELEASS